MSYAAFLAPALAASACKILENDPCPLDAIDAATTTRPRVKTTQLRYTAVAVTIYMGSRAPRPFADMSKAAGALYPPAYFKY